MTILRISKLAEVAARAEAWLEEAVTTEQAEELDDQIVSVGHVLIVVELRSRAEDRSAADGRSIRAWVSSYCDDSREWVQRALLSEASDLHTAGGAGVQIFVTPDDEEEEADDD